MDVEPSVSVVEESSPAAAAAAAEPINEEPAPATPVPPVTVVQVRQVSLSKVGGDGSTPFGFYAITTNSFKTHATKSPISYF